MFNAICLRNSNGKDIDILSRSICSLANTAFGGFILIGIKNDSYGGKSYSKSSRVERETVFNSCMKKLGPIQKIKLQKMEFVPILANPFKKYSTKNSECKYLIRIQIKSKDNQVFFLK